MILNKFSKPAFPAQKTTKNYLNTLLNKQIEKKPKKRFRLFKMKA